MDRRRAQLLVFLTAMVAYGAALAGDFVYDDLHSVRDNLALQSLANLPSYFWDLDAFSALEARMYRPVLLVSFALSHAIGGGAVWAFKLTDLLIHAGCALLLFSLARSLRAGRGPALAVAMLFAAHPLASEAVNLVSSRSDQLLALFALAAMRFQVAAMAGHRGAIVGTALCCAAACGCKETGVLIPGCLLALEFVRARRKGLDPRGIALRVAPAITASIFYLALRRMLFGVATVAVPKLALSTDVATGAGRDLWTQLCAMSYVLPRFLGQSIAPVGLSLDPWVPFVRGWSVAVVGGWAVVLLLTWLGLRAPRRRPAVFVGTVLAWTLAAPWVLIPLNAPAGEHRMYASLAGLALCATVAIPRRMNSTQRVAVMAAVLLFAFLSARRSLGYVDSEGLWRSALAQHPRSVVAMDGLAEVHRERGIDAARRGDAEVSEQELRAALEMVERALAVQPRHVPSRKAAVRLRLLLGPRCDDPLVAVAHAERLHQRRPDNPIVQILLAQSLIAAGRYTGERRWLDEAEQVALHCLEIAEPKGLVYRVAAESRVAAGDLDAALSHLDASIGRGLDHSSVRNDRAALLLQMGRADEARREVAGVLAADPFDGRAMQLLQQIHSAAPGR